MTKGERKITNQELKNAIDESRNVSDLKILIRKKQKFDEIDSNEKTNDIEMVEENDEVVSADVE